LSERIEKVGNAEMAEQMKLFWKRRVFKVLFNMVNVSHRVEKLRVISTRMFDS
jgi:hypothetical protein